MKPASNFFVYTATLSGNKETLIESNLTQLQAQDLCDEYRNTLEKNCPNEYASYGDTIYQAAIAKRLGLI